VWLMLSAIDVDAGRAMVALIVMAFLTVAGWLAPPSASSAPVAPAGSAGTDNAQRCRPCAVRTSAPPCGRANDRDQSRCQGPDLSRQRVLKTDSKSNAG
jgi:hypothetical protein